PPRHHRGPEGLEGKPAGPAPYVRSLTSTLCQLLAGRHAYQAGDGDDAVIPLLLRVVRDDLPGIARTDVPPGLMLAIRRAMAKDPGDRFPGAVAFGQALQQVQADAGLPVTELPYVAPQAPAPDPPPTATPPTATPPTATPPTATPPTATPPTA